MSLEIVDCHFHFYDRKVNAHPFLETYDAKLANMWGTSYNTKFSEAYRPADYLKDMQHFNVSHVVMAELVSTDPLKEMHFAQDIANQHPLLSGAIANIDILDKNLPQVLSEYANIPVVRAVRDHLLWDPHNPENCYTRRGGILSEPIVAASFKEIQKYPFAFEFEIYAPEIPHVLRYAKQFPEINFALHCLGWPLDKTAQGFQEWKQHMQALSQCPNVFVKITAIECIFGLQWTLAEVSPWIKTTIDLFGSDRCMFGSHLPIAKLSHGVSFLYDAYQAIVAGFSREEQQNLFANTAKRFYRIASV